MELEIQYFDNSENMKRTAEFLEQEYENAFGAERLDVVLRGYHGKMLMTIWKMETYDCGFGSMVWWSI